MDGERGIVSLAPEQGVAREGGDGFVQQRFVGGKGL